MVIGEEAAGPNELKTLEISTCLRFMTNDFEYVESIVRSWISSSKNGRPFPKTERTSSADELCTILDDLERKIGVTLPTRLEFGECIHSDAIESWDAIFLTVLPKLRGEVLNAIYKTLQALPYPIWSELLPEIFANQVLPPFCAKQYLSAVRRGCDALRAVIRAKTGRHDLDPVLEGWLS